MKKKGKVTIGAMLIVALLASMTFVSAVGMQEHGIDTEKSYEVDKLSQVLEDAVTGYNEAVTEGRIEDVEGYVEEIDQIIAKLEALGMEVEFMETHGNQGMPASVSVSVNPVTEQNRPRGHSISANEEQLEIMNQLVGQDITMGEFYEKVIPEVLEDTPEEIVEFLYATKMIWPDPSMPPKGEDHSQTVVTKAFKPAYNTKKSLWGGGGLMMWTSSSVSIAIHPLYHSGKTRITEESSSVSIAIHPTGIFYFIVSMILFLLIILLLFLYRRYRGRKTIK